MFLWVGLDLTGLHVSRFMPGMENTVKFESRRAGICASDTVAQMKHRKKAVLWVIWI
jgi:hypothetical protein